MKIAKKFIPLFVITFSSLVSLLLIEFFLQALKKNDPLYITSNANILRNFEFTYDIAGLYESEFPSVYYYRNKYGLRDNCKKISDIEILTIGGSTTDQRYVPFNSTYQKILQDRLIKENNRFGCVSNAGVDGHTTWGHIFAFKEWFPLIKDLSPDYVILYIGTNDANFEHMNSPNIGSDVVGYGIKSKLKEWEIVRRLLPLYRFLRQYFVKNATHAQHDLKFYKNSDYIITQLNNSTINLAEQNAKSFRLRFKEILKLVNNIGATPVCVSQPHRYVKVIDGELRVFQMCLENNSVVLIMIILLNH